MNENNIAQRLIYFPRNQYFLHSIHKMLEYPVFEFLIINDYIVTSIIHSFIAFRTPITNLLSYSIMAL